MRSAAAPEARSDSAAAAGGSAHPALASDDERGAAAKGAGAQGASDSQERRGDLSPSSLRNRQRLRTQPPRSRAPPRRRLWLPRCPAPARSPPTGAPTAPSRLPWKDATRGGRKFIRPNTPPRRRERKLQERYTPSSASPWSQGPRTFTRPPQRGWQGSDRAPRLRDAFPPRPPDGLGAPALAGPHRFGILSLSNNFAESHHVTI